MSRPSKALIHLGALLSDLTAQLWAYAVENETGESLVVRRREIHATLGAIAKLCDAPKESLAPPRQPLPGALPTRRQGKVPPLPMGYVKAPGKK